MRQAPRSVTAAAALLASAALVGCGVSQEPPALATTPPLVSHGPDAAAEPPTVDPLAPPRAVPEPPAATAHDAPTRTPASPSPTPAPMPTQTTIASPTPSAVRLVGLLPRVAELAPLRWTDDAGEHSAPWTEVAPAVAIAPGAALPHVAAAREAGGACASAADAVDGRAGDAAMVSLAAAPAPGAPIDLVLVRYPSASAAAAAIAALQALGTACDGVATADGTLGSATPSLSAAAVLAGDGARLVVDAMGEGAMLVAIVHEGAPPEAVEALVAAQLARLA